MLGIVDNRDISLNPYNFPTLLFKLFSDSSGWKTVPWALLQPSFSDYTPDLLEGTGYLVTLGTHLDESSLSADTSCTVSI